MVPEVVAVFDPVKVVGNSTAHCVFRFIITVRMQNAPPSFTLGLARACQWHFYPMTSIHGGNRHHSHHLQMTVMSSTIKSVTTTTAARIFHDTSCAIALDTLFDFFCRSFFLPQSLTVLHTF